MMRIRISQIVEDIRTGLNDDELMKKHRLSPVAFQRLLQLIVRQRAMDHEELYEKSTAYKIITDVLSARRSKRVYVRQPIRVFHKERGQKGFVRDISEDGVRAAGIAAQVGERLTLSMPLTEIEGATKVEFPATCRWRKTAGRTTKYPVCGFQIADSDDDLRIHLRALIDFLRSSPQSEVERIYPPLSGAEFSDSLKSVQRKSKSQKFSGRIDDVDILDIVQLMMLSGKKSRIEILTSTEEGCELHFDEGRVVHAVKGELQGTEAFFACMDIPGGEFVARPLPDLGKQSIKEPGDFLLFEAARRRDDSADELESTLEFDDISEGTTEDLEELEATENPDQPRWFPFAPLPVYDAENFMAEGNVVEISEKGILVSGINATVGQTKNLLVQADAFEHVYPFSFEAVCRWSTIEPSGSPSAWFEITDISKKGEEEFRKLLKSLAFTE